MVEAVDLPDALAEALSDGVPVAPLPPVGVERQQAVAMLQPGVSVEPGTAVVVATSGSTGRPKGVRLSAPAVAASVAATHERLGGPGDWVLALPPHYVAGLMVLARAQLAGTRAHRVAVDLTDLPSAAAAATGRRYLSLVPTQLGRVLDQPAVVEALQVFDAVLVGGGALPRPLAERAQQAGIAVVTSYGMSETCGGCVYDGLPLPGVDVALDEDGRVRIAGAPLFSGYRLRPDLTAAALVEDRLVTADRAHWVDGRLEVLGRVDDVVVSGGLNVDLAEVERAVRSWPALAGVETAVVGVPDRRWGTAVVAVAEMAVDVGTLERLRVHLAELLPPYAAPRRLVGRIPLPRTSSGKIDRRRMVAELTEEAVPTTPAEQVDLTEQARTRRSNP